MDKIERVAMFCIELFKLYDKYNISISHEDGHGSFVLENNSEDNREWMLNADIRKLKFESEE